MRMRGLTVCGLVTLFLGGLVCPAWAEKDDMQIRFGLLYSNPTDDLVTEGETTEADDAFGFQASFEYGVTDRIGVEPAISTANHDVEVSEAGLPDLDLGDIDLFTLTANVNFHLLPEKNYDLYVGPTIGYAFWGDLESDVFEESFSADNEFIYGLNFGADVPFGEGKWGFAGAINYLFSEVSLDGATEDIGVDPIQLKVGVTYRF